MALSVLRQHGIWKDERSGLGNGNLGPISVLPLTAGGFRRGL